MKQKLIKLLSLVLALTFMLSVFSICASAAYDDDLTAINKIVSKNDTRISGETRYETSIAIADKLKTALGIKKFDTIILAYGRNYADALAGSYLSSLMSAPILIVNTDKNNKNDAASMTLVKKYIDQNLTNDGTIYILGGEAVISKEYAKSLEKGKRTVTRLAGENRYETNLKILEECVKYKEENEIYDGDILICDAYGFADALSCSSVGKAILLIDKSSGKLTKEQKKFLNKNAYHIYIIGGTSAVPESIEKEALNSLEYSNTGCISRLAGENRYETSQLIAQEFCTTPTCAVLAYGHDFPDGLCGGPLAYALKSPLVLINNDEANLSYAKEYFETNYTQKFVVIGGEKAVTNDTVVDLRSSQVTSAPKWVDPADRKVTFTKTKYEFNGYTIEFKSNKVVQDWQDEWGIPDSYREDFKGDLYPVSTAPTTCTLTPNEVNGIKTLFLIHYTMTNSDGVTRSSVATAHPEYNDDYYIKFGFASDEAGIPVGNGNFVIDITNIEVYDF